jgi:ketosteroid isomerase-like protein
MRNIRLAGSALFAAVTMLAPSAWAQTRPGLGGNVGDTRSAASAYRAQVRNIVGKLTTDLSDVWDGADASKPAAFYDPNAALSVGPDATFEGRAAIRKAFSERLGKMRGVLFTIDWFDMSDELAFVRGTMSYDVPRPGERQTMTFTMALRLKRGDWVIQSHTIGGPAALPD